MRGSRDIDGRRRRWLLPLVVALLGSPLLVGTSSGQTDDEIIRPEVFTGEASSLVASVQLDREGLLPVPELFRFILIEGDGTYSGPFQEARASLFFPGNGVQQGPSLACGTFGGQFPDFFKPLLDACLAFRYPLTVYGDALNPTDSSEGANGIGREGDPVSAGSASAVVVATVEETRTDAEMSEVEVLGLPAFGQVDLGLPIPGAPEVDPTIFTMGSATATTDQRIEPDGSLVVESRSEISDLRVVGGLLQIESIITTATITDDGRGTKSQDATVDVSGVTFAGVPAEITDEGLVVGSPGGSGPLTDALTPAINQLIEGFGLEVRTIGAEHGVGPDGIPFARSEGIIVEMATDVNALPIIPGPIGDLDLNGTYVGTMQFGSSGAKGLATFIDPISFEPGPSVGGDGLIDTGGGTVAIGAPSSPTGGGGVTPALPATPVPDSPSVPTGQIDPSLGPEAFTPLFDELFADRLRLLYLSLLMGALLITLAPRLSLPARLPGPRS